mmetsp:Transcript_11799/g.28641  ORF Transcript_11799/g.28641 Transcript_11799/m.28641 type:complete len:208 (-) Transcript_11799:510-1133(-)
MRSRCGRSRKGTSQSTASNLGSRTRTAWWDSRRQRARGGVNAAAPATASSWQGLALQTWRSGWRWSGTGPHPCPPSVQSLETCKRWTSGMPTPSHTRSLSASLSQRGGLFASGASCRGSPKTCRSIASATCAGMLRLTSRRTTARAARAPSSSRRRSGRGWGTTWPRGGAALPRARWCLTTASPQTAPRFSPRSRCHPTLHATTFRT